MASWCCNCFMYGRVDQRLEKFPSTNKDDFSLFSSGCAIMCIADYVHLFCIPLWMKRQEMRRRFNIKGNGCTDCLAAYFCHCCTLSQMSECQYIRLQESHGANLLRNRHGVQDSRGAGSTRGQGCSGRILSAGWGNGVSAAVIAAMGTRTSWIGAGCPSALHRSCAAYCVLENRRFRLW
jgi:Cys-rich protein (TIGR01571 family)